MFAMICHRGWREEKNSSYQDPRSFSKNSSSSLFKIGGRGAETGEGKKAGADQRYKRNGTPRIEWPFGLMPNYFLPVKRKREERGV